MAPSKCFSPINAEVIRVTRLDVCGIPVTGTSAQAVIDGFTEVTNAPNYEDGQRFLLRQASGAPCVNELGAAFFNWLEQGVTVCSLDPAVLQLVTGERLITDGVTGVGMAFGESGLLDDHYSIEVWQPVAGANACDEGGLQNFFYWAFPNLFSARINDFTFQNDTFTLQWTGTTRQASTSWDLWEDWLPASAQIVSGDHYMFGITTTPPPESYCGTTAVA